MGTSVGFSVAMNIPLATPLYCSFPADGSASQSASEFFLIFSNNHGYDLTLYISTPDSELVGYEVLSSSEVHFSGNISSATYASVTFNSSVFVNSTETDIGIVVRATDPQKPLTVSGVNIDQYAADAFLALPVGPATETYTYITNSMLRGTGDGCPAIHIVATQNNTNLTIIPRESAGNLNSQQHFFRLGKPSSLTLDWLETHQIESMWDLTGTTIVSDKPLSVFAGQVSCGADDVSGFDHLFEQIPPTSTWGRFFFIVPYNPLSSTSSMSYKVIASKPFTAITTTCFLLKTSQQIFTYQTYITGVGDFEQFQIEQSSYCYISAENPVLVMYYNGDSDSSGGPLMMIVIPNEQFVINSTVAFNVYNNFYSYITIVVLRKEAPKENELKLDGVDLSSRTWSLLYCSEGDLCGFTYSTSIRSAGLQSLVYSQIPVAVYVHGVTAVSGLYKHGYAYPASMALRSKLTMVHVVYTL